MAVCRQGAATGGLYRKAVHASRFLSCLVRSVRMSTVFHTVTLLLEREPLSLLFLTICISFHYLLLVKALIINAMSKSLAAFLVVAGLVSGQGYSSPGRTNEAAGSTASTIFTSALTTSPDSSTTDTAASSYNTVTLYYCKTPTFSAIGPFVTIYNTVYIDVCSTGGLTQVTYTITDTCGCQHETDYTRPTGCPSGFTTTEKTCSMCSGSPVITCTTPIAPVSETSNPATAPAGSSQVSNTPYSQNPQYTMSGSTPSSAPGTTPSYFTTNNAKPVIGSSRLGLIMVTSMAVVAGLICIL